MGKKEDIDETLVFSPIEEEVVSQQRKSPEYEEYYEDEYEEYEEEDEEEYYPAKREQNKKTLIYTCFILAIVLVITVTVSIVILSNTGETEVKNTKEPQPVQKVDKEEEDEEKETSPKKEEAISKGYSSFYPGGIKEEKGGYILTAKLYDESMMMEGSRSLYLNDDTEIIVNSERWSDEKFVELLKGRNVEDVLFEVEIDKKNRKIISVYFDGEINTEEEPEEENIEKEESGEENTEDVEVKEESSTSGTEQQTETQAPEPQPEQPQSSMQETESSTAETQGEQGMAE